MRHDGEIKVGVDSHITTYKRSETNQMVEIGTMLALYLDQTQHCHHNVFRVHISAETILTSV